MFISETTKIPELLQSPIWLYTFPKLDSMSYNFLTSQAQQLYPCQQKPLFIFTSSFLVFESNSHSFEPCKSSTAPAFLVALSWCLGFVYVIFLSIVSLAQHLYTVTCHLCSQGHWLKHSEYHFWMLSFPMVPRRR